MARYHAKELIVYCMRYNFYRFGCPVIGATVAPMAIGLKGKQDGTEQIGQNDTSANKAKNLQNCLACQHQL